MKAACVPSECIDCMSPSPRRVTLASVVLVLSGCWRETIQDSGRGLHVRSMIFGAHAVPRRALWCGHTGEVHGIPEPMHAEASLFSP